MTVSIQEIVAANDLIKRAYEFARNAHRGKKQKNGEPFFNHCLATAETLANWRMDQETIAAGLLHDLDHVMSEDEAFTVVNENFGNEIACLIEKVSKISKLPYYGTENKIGNLQKFILFLSDDVRVILIKFASRLDMLQSLYSHPIERQKQIALKAIEIYAPIARQLGMNHAAGELEDLAFPYIHPKDHQTLIASIKEPFEEREKYLKEFKPRIEKELKIHDARFIRTDFRSKRYYSLYKKLLRYDMDLDQIYDLIAVRVIVPTVSDCYTALGIIHKTWPPIPGRIKDYIATPKPNGYRSLHTTISTPENHLTEIQIRTEDMHHEAELGVAAHFAYQTAKGTKSYLSFKTALADTKELGFIRALREFPRRISTIQFFQNQILVLTPKGEVIDLPAGATPVDFAYKIHTDIGHSTTGALINKKMVTLDTPLSSGDVVKIMTQKNKGPSESWLKFIKTTHARDSIRYELKKSASRFLKKTTPALITLKISTNDRNGLLQDITKLFIANKIKIHDIDIREQKNNDLQTIHLRYVPPSGSKNETVLKKLKTINGVKKIARSNPTKM